MTLAVGQVSARFRASRRYAWWCVLADAVVILATLDLFAFDPRRSLLPLVVVVQAEGGIVLGLPGAFFAAQLREHANEGLLPHVLDGVPGIKARTQLQADELAEVADEVLFGCRVSGFELFKVRLIECDELQTPFLRSRLARAQVYTAGRGFLQAICPDDTLPRRFSSRTLDLANRAVSALP